MGLDKSRHNRASLNALPEDCRKALIEYYELARSPELSEHDFLKMQAILETAESNDVMSLLINEIDEMTFQELGLYTEDQCSNFANEVSRVQEFVLDETARKLLVPSGLFKQTKSIKNFTSSSHHPRVEMVFDANHTARMQLEKRYRLDELSMCSTSRSQNLIIHSLELYKQWVCYVGETLYALFLEESVSLFVIAVWVLLLLLLLT